MNRLFRITIPVFTATLAIFLTALSLSRDAAAHSPGYGYGYGKHQNHHRDYRKKNVRKRYWYKNQRRQHPAVYGYKRHAAPAVIVINRGTFSRFFDRVDRRHIHRALETAPVGQAVVWNNPTTGNRYSVVPVKTWQAPDSTYCREYTTTGVIGGVVQDLYGTACRQPDGSWLPQQ